MATRWARVLRGVVAALVASIVAGLAHVAGGGAAPSAVGTALVLALCIPVCVLLAGRTLSLPRIAIAVTASQAAFHTLFLLTGNSSAAIAVHAATGIHGMSGMAGMGTLGTHASSDGRLPDAFGGVGAADGIGQHGMADPLMWLAHLAAAVLTVLALRYGEGAFWALLELARIALVRFLSVAVTAVGGSTRASWVGREAPSRRRACFLLAGLRHRGPPAFAGSSA